MNKFHLPNLDLLPYPINSLYPTLLVHIAIVSMSPIFIEITLLKLVKSRNLGATGKTNLFIFRVNTSQNSMSLSEKNKKAK